ncbi:MAG: HEPN domain-containing protein [Chloroflexota bacterium]
MGKYSAEIVANLERANDSLQAAKDLLEKDHYDVAASRAYYAAFYAASALLLGKNIDPSKHSGVISAIHREFVKSGKLSTEQGKSLNWLFELRGVGDYGVIVHVSEGEAIRAAKVAGDFVDAVKRLLD